jgi:hypothetical protein
VWPGRSLGRAGAAGRLLLGALVVTEAGDDVAKRAELGDDRVAPLLVAVDLGLERREGALGLGLTGRAEAGGLALRR